MKPLFNFALSCRACDEAECVKACPEKALSQSEDTGVLMVNENRCKGCDWCVQACPHGGIAINPDTGFAMACDVCGGDAQCVEFCPEEALVIVATDEEAEKLMSDTLERLPEETEKVTNIVKNKDWKPILNEAEKRSEKISEKLEALSKKGRTKKQKK
jgi:Fe-S-cluster-containing dehydrogenase component